MVYSGRAGGSYATRGGAANHLCLPEDPEYTLPYRDGVQGFSFMYGAEYESPVQGTDDHDVPCAVCMTTGRGIVLTIPAKTSCPDETWSKEYEGYLMSGRKDLKRSNFECVDRGQEAVPGSKGNVNGALFYHVEAQCFGLKCPPYDPEKELNCVVCTI